MTILFLTSVNDEKRHCFYDFPGARMLFDDPKDLDAETLASVDAIFGNPSRDLVEKCANLRWIQLNSAGANKYSWLPEHIVLTNASGAYGPAISEHMLGCTLGIMKNLFRYHDLQKRKDLRNLGSVRMLETSVVLSVGAGDIGGHYLHKCKSLGAYTIGIRRKAHEKAPYEDESLAFSQVDDVLPRADIVALSLPETRETVGFFDYRRLSLMKKDAILLNVGRGSAIVTDDLVRIVNEGHLAGVHLDVTDPEPLPEDHPLWNTERIYVTPHIAGRFNAEVTLDRVLDIFSKNLAHALKNEPFENVVDRSIGY